MNEGIDPNVRAGSNIGKSGGRLSARKNIVEADINDELEDLVLDKPIGSNRNKKPSVIPKTNSRAPTNIMENDDDLDDLEDYIGGGNKKKNVEPPASKKRKN